MLSFKLKTDYLAKIPKSLLDDISASIHHSLCESLREGLPPAVREHLYFELAFLLTRHRAWVEDEIFQALTDDLLARDFRFSSQTRTAIMRGIFPKTRESKGDFLFYLIARGLPLWDSDTLRGSLGFGSGLGYFLADCHSYLTKADHKFQSDCLARFQHVVLKVLQKLKSEIYITPWAIDVLRLRFLMEECAHPGGLSETMAEGLMRLLVVVGTQKVIDYKSIRGYAEKYLKRAGTNDLTHDQLISYLQSLGLLYQVKGALRKEQIQYALSDLGAQISADAYACQQTRSTKWPLEALTGAGVRYQTAMMLRLVRAQPNMAAEVLRAHGHLLSPACLRRGFSELSGLLSSEQVLDIMREILRSRPSSWTQQALLEAAAKLEADGNYVRQFLEDVRDFVVSPKASLQLDALALRH